MSPSPSSSSPHTADVAVIGSGIVGLSTAHQLMDRGLSCLLIDAKGPAGETSFGNAGSISVGNVMPQSTPGIVTKALRMLANPLAPLKLDWAVSPSYAHEILTPAYGMGMEGLIAARLADLSGIVNGIDAHVWDPATDPMIAATYSASRMKRRAVNRQALAERFSLVQDNGPIFCVVSRLTWQKGMDLLAEVVDEIVERGGKLAVLGSGDAALEAALMAAAARHPGRIGIVIGYNEPLSHLMQAGADAILIPSRFEPCGLTQLYGLRYGCIPVVARTGGLADTVIDANEAALSARVATGFQFTPINADGLRQALRRVFKAYSEPKIWARIQNQGMKSDVSWENSAARYANLYSSLLSRAHPS